MPIISHETISDDYIQADGERGIHHEFTDHLSKVHLRGSRRVPGTWTETEYLAERTALTPLVEADLATQEVQQQIDIAIQGGNPDKVPPEHQTQPDFDRRFLGESMLLDAQPFFNCKPVYDRVVTMGNNAAQRAAYLGVPTLDYGLVEDRYDNVNGVAWFLEDEKNMQWDEVNEAFI